MSKGPEQGPWCSTKEFGIYQTVRRVSLKVSEQSRWALCSDLYLERSHCGRENRVRGEGLETGKQGTTVGPSAGDHGAL